MRTKVRQTALSAAALLVFTACSVSDLSAPSGSNSSNNSADSGIIRTSAVAAGYRGASIRNQPPTDSIISPQAGASFAPGVFITFSGTAVDPETGTLSGSALVWKSDRDGQIGTGNTFASHSLSIGNHIITLTAKDPKGLTASYNRAITVAAPNQAPTASISAPTDATSIVQGTSTTFTGNGTDLEDGTLADSLLRWTSSADGLIGTGRSFSRNNLSLGVHTVTLSVTDSRGATAAATRMLTVTAPTTSNQAPSCWISTPAFGATVAQGIAISFTGSATDPEDGTLSGASIAWRSSIDGQIGAGASFSKSNLSVGAHTITMTCTDSRGASFSHNRSITVTAPTTNQAPSASISAPGSSASFVQGASVSFSGSATDAESGVLSGTSLVWTSSRDGQIGTGTSFSRSTLTVGTHTITLTARDPQGAIGTASRTITVSTSAPANQAPVANFTASCTLLVCSFNASSSTDDNGVTQYSWNFGNGTSTTAMTSSVSNTYLVAATVNVSLTVSDASGLTNSMTKSISITSGSTSGGGPEPTGMTKLAENDFSCFSACGNGWYYGQDYANASQVVQDALAPRSGGSVVQQNYTPSLVPGSSPASIGTGLSPKQTVYASIWMKISSNYLGHDSGVNKVLHFYTASRSGGSNIAIFLLRGAGSGTLVPSFGVQNLAAPYRWTDPTGVVHFETVANLDPNVGACSVTRGRWTRYEMVLTSNTPGVADGRVELWMDGTKCADYSGITYAAAGTDSRWNEVNWSPTYGGAGGTITTSFFEQVDHLYVSGK